MSYNLKMKASRAIFSEINTKFPTMPFTLRALQTEHTRFGIVECLNHDLLHPYPVLHEKATELVRVALNPKPYFHHSYISCISPVMATFFTFKVVGRERKLQGSVSVSAIKWVYSCGGVGGGTVPSMECGSQSYSPPMC